MTMPISRACLIECGDASDGRGRSLSILPCPEETDVLFVCRCVSSDLRGRHIFWRNQKHRQGITACSSLHDARTGQSRDETCMVGDAWINEQLGTAAQVTKVHYMAGGVTQGESCKLAVFL